jgi:hypothetical protein
MNEFLLPVIMITCLVITLLYNQPKQNYCIAKRRIE